VSLRLACLLIALALLALLAPVRALAAGCTTPIGTAGDFLFNSTYSVMQYCDGTDWVNMGVTNQLGTLTPGDFCTSSKRANAHHQCGQRRHRNDSAE
jgi:hypothetical protein